MHYDTQQPGGGACHPHIYTQYALHANSWGWAGNGVGMGCGVLVGVLLCVYPVFTPRIRTYMDFMDLHTITNERPSWSSALPQYSVICLLNPLTVNPAWEQQAQRYTEKPGVLVPFQYFCTVE